MIRKMVAKPSGMPIYQKTNINQMELLSVQIVSIICFLSDYKGDLNLKLQSVLLDASSIEIQSLIRALGIVFFSHSTLVGNVKRWCRICRPI